MQETSSNSWQIWAQSHPIAAKQITTPRLNKYIPVNPTEKQTLFLLLNHIPEIFYGGAAGGAKSYGLLMAALQFVDLPKYNALLLRKTFQDLAKPDALIPISKEWLMGTDAAWNERDKRWTFPSGATLSFGYLEHENDVYQYQGSAFQFIGVDELTQHLRKVYLYLFSRLRKEKNNPIPIRMRSTGNPGGLGHEWVKERFILPFIEGNQDVSKRLFIPSKLTDNPHLNQQEYRENSLSNLDDVTRKRLEDGDWNVSEGTGVFRFSDEQFYTPVETEALPGHRYVGGLDWGEDNDFTVGSIFDITEHRQVALYRENNVSYGHIGAKLVELSKRWKVEKWIAERNAMGKSAMEHMLNAFEAADWPKHPKHGYSMQPVIQSFVTSNKSKVDLVSYFQDGIQSGMKLLDEPIQKSELYQYGKKQLPASNLWSYGAISGHDDTVIGNMLANYACYEYRVDFA